MSKTVFNPEKMYTYIRGFASGLHMEQTLKALTFAREKHHGQFRKSGEPYIIHPLTMACNALSMGINDDATIATILLHDVCEDCGVALQERPRPSWCTTDDLHCDGWGNKGNRQATVL